VYFLLSSLSDEISFLCARGGYGMMGL